MPTAPTAPTADGSAADLSTAALPRPELRDEDGPVLRRTLVPLDGSRLAEGAIHHAAAIGTSLGTEIRLLRVLESHGPVADPTLGPMDWKLQRLEAETYLEEIATRLRGQGLVVTTAVGEGRAADEIVQHVREHGIDLVVVSAYGHGGVCEFPAGGTVRKLLSLAPCSLMMVRPDEEGGPAEAPLAYHRILVPVDGSAVAEWGMLLGAGVARAQRGELLVVHVASTPAPAWDGHPPSPEETELTQRLGELRRDRARGYLDRVEAELDSPALRVRGRLIAGDRVERAILAAAAEEHADLIALSAHGSDAAPGACGAVTQRLLAGSPIPVLVFQDRPDRS